MSKNKNEPTYLSCTVFTSNALDININSSTQKMNSSGFLVLMSCLCYSENQPLEKEKFYTVIGVTNFYSAQISAAIFDIFYKTYSSKNVVTYKLNLLDVLMVHNIYRFQILNFTYLWHKGPSAK